MSIRCVSIFRPFRSFNLLLRLASSARARRPLIRKLHLSDRGAYSLARAFITLFFPLPQGATENRKRAAAAER